MRFRASLAFVLVAAASACTFTSDSPLAPDVDGARFEREGVKPPPPLGTEDTYMEIDANLSESPPEGDFTAADHVPEHFDAQVFGRYFANTQSNNKWIAFDRVLGATIPVSQNARLAYNEDQLRTSGHGTLVDADGTVLDMALVTILSWSSFGSCAEDDEVPVHCAVITFRYGNNPFPAGTIDVWTSDPGTEVPPPTFVADHRVGNN
jgi:hypothetical protein